MKIISTDRSEQRPVSNEFVLAGKDRSLLQSRVRRILIGIAGFFALVLAVLGIFVPGMPCTPFALLSAALFARSSDRMYNRLLNNSVLGPRIKKYHRRKGVAKRDKIKIILLMSAMVLISAFLIIDAPSLRIVVLLSGLTGGIVVYFFVPEGEDFPTSEEKL